MKTWTAIWLGAALTCGSAHAAPERPPMPVRDPSGPDYVKATELPDGAVPPADRDGNFIIGPTHTPAPEMTVAADTPRGTVYTFTMSSADSKIYPGIVRDADTFGTVDPDNPAKLIVTTSRPAPYTRKVSVYVPMCRERQRPSSSAWTDRMRLCSPRSTR